MDGRPVNDWPAIRAFYREAHQDIVGAGRNEWGIDPYLWDTFGMIRMTPIEAWLWHDIRYCDAVLYPQFPIGKYVVDFANPVAKVAVECDGAAYHTDKAKDAIRDADLMEQGWSVYRAPGWLCRTDTDPETGKKSDAHELILRICYLHGIDRASRIAPKGVLSPVSVFMADAKRIIQRESEIRAAVQKARSRA